MATWIPCSYIALCEQMAQLLILTEFNSHLLCQPGNHNSNCWVGSWSGRDPFPLLGSPFSASLRPVCIRSRKGCIRNVKERGGGGDALEAGKDNNNNNNNNNNNRIQRRYSRFFYNLLTAPWTISNTYTQVARAQPCANHVKHIERLSHASVMLRATWYEGTAQLWSLTELKLHLFELYFIGWTIKPMKEGRKPEYPEKTPGCIRNVNRGRGMHYKQERMH